MKIKVCGLSNSKEVQKSVEYGSDFCGFILNYPKSHRYVTYEKISDLIKIDRKTSSYVGVLVKPSEAELLKFSKLEFDYFQIYGDYNDEQIFQIKKKYKKKIIVAIQVKEKNDIKKYKNIRKSADIILWDSSGLEKSLSWNFEWMNIVPKNIIKMIAGNININNLEKLSKIADIIDVSGALETNKVKDVDKIKNFIKKVKKINDQN
jgi:phosphoribosylanthranilate isomerase